MMLPQNPTEYSIQEITEPNKPAHFSESETPSSLEHSSEHKKSIPDEESNEAASQPDSVEPNKAEADEEEEEEKEEVEEEGICATTAPTKNDVVAVEESSSSSGGRERLKRHRVEVAGRVWIPDMWGQEDLLKDWIDCAAFDSSLVNSSIVMARDSLVEEGRRANSACRLRIENSC